MTLNLHRLKFIVVLLFIALIGLYGYVKTSDLLSGPTIVIKEPTVGEVFDRPFITITGQAKRISRLYLNDSQIFTDDRGYFSESLLLLPGYNILKLKAEDNFDRETVEILELVLTSSPV